ncbi:dTDP-4-dehydrorhamnose reductase [Ignavibacterium album JCM 16511]|uniref:dTDP-4-dehydrorhamnose reductase n=1 Tax=Ignavibacterium album (strain DSM 19864 / JCM 16511 / NBRC 101810 / Mat9-16) TaxID=945713 RepID=I0AHG8_IGNAJ|nr:NAD(P)-dependent oxidoreductase [Ignavibacterium album]AFH48425.1 dTDP-4-dehydrorhamnose reductase [Ignavibacterium album JCM 16511]
MKVLITGGSGFLGQYLNIFLSERHQIVTTFYNNSGNTNEFNSIHLDLRNFSVLRNIFSNFIPDVVVHTAAVSDTILNENISTKDVYGINVNVTEELAKLCNEYDAKLIYTSTDLVYAGYRGSFLKEDAKLIPVSLYAETKLMGEVKIKQTFDNYIILRTALLFGFGLNHAKCHFQYIYEQLRNNKPVKVFTDQFRSPVSVIEAARLISEMIDKNISCQIINFGGPERVSRYELTERLCDIAGLDKNLLIKIKLDDMPELPKVEDVSLNIDKLKSYGLIPKQLDEMIREVLNYQN